MRKILTLLLALSVPCMLLPADVLAGSRHSTYHQNHPRHTSTRQPKSEVPKVKVQKPKAPPRVRSSGGPHAPRVQGVGRPRFRQPYIHHPRIRSRRPDDKEPESPQTPALPDQPQAE